MLTEYKFKILLALTADPSADVRQAARYDILVEWEHMADELADLRNKTEILPTVETQP